MKEWKEIRFKIQALTPETLPMARLASYIAELAKILGEDSNVHFDKVVAGCAQLKMRIAEQSYAKVYENVRAVRTGKGTQSQMRAYSQTNRMLVDDKSSAKLVEGKKNVLPFRGKEEEPPRTITVHQRGEIDGEVIRVGGSGEIAHVSLEVEGMQISGCDADRTIAKKLAKHLYEPVRLFGEGNWVRNIDGKWELERFVIQGFEPLNEATLSEEIATLRQFKGEWNEDSLHEILRYRL